jgi:hypothetical protein
MVEAPLGVGTGLLPRTWQVRILLGQLSHRYGQMPPVQPRGESRPMTLP